MSSASNTFEWVKIVSNDGFEFPLPRAAALGNRTLRDMLDMEIGLSESLSNTIKLDYRAAVVQVLVEYLQSKYHANNNPLQFMQRIPAELSLEVLMAADFLGA